MPLQSKEEKLFVGIRKKAQEIGFALLKISGHIRRRELAARIDAQSYSLIEDVYSGNFADALTRIEVLKGFIALGSNLGEINPGNSQIIFSEMNNLGATVKQIKDSGPESETLDLASMFTGPVLSQPHRQKLIRKPLPAKRPAMELENAAIGNSNVLKDSSAKAELPNQNQLNESNKAKIRQDLILGKFKNASGGRLQLKEILPFFPETSERTLRYDLERLCEQGVLHREGKGGPSNYYVLAEGVIPVGE